MKSSSTLFFGLTGIDLPLASAPGLSLGNGYKAVNDRASIGRLIGSYVEFIGTVENAFLLDRAKAVGYRRSYLELDADQISESINGELLRNLFDLNVWLIRLWLIKDNSVNVDSGWIAVGVGKEIQVSNNRFAIVNTKADGKMDNTPFSKLELEEAQSIPVEARYWANGPVGLAIELNQDPASTQLAADKNRFWRFMYFVHVGRGTMDVPMKIAHWCSGLEALVSSSQTELSHQVAERTAAALYSIGADRMNTFTIVKHAYGIRSKAVHGAAFKPKDLPRLTKSAELMDNVCRKLARLYIENDGFSSAIESESADFDHYWLKKIMVGDEDVAPDRGSVDRP